MQSFIIGPSQKTLAKLTVFTRHAGGVAVAKFRTPGGAAACLEAMHGRFFGGRAISCQYWDGVEDFTAAGGESAREREEREEDFGKWLESVGGEAADGGGGRGGGERTGGE